MLHQTTVKHNQGLSYRCPSLSQPTINGSAYKLQCLIYLNVKKYNVSFLQMYLSYFGFIMAFINIVSRCAIHVFIHKVKQLYIWTEEVIQRSIGSVL